MNVRDLVLLAFVVLFGWTSTYACSVEIESLRKHFRHADTVFVGRVTSVRETTLSEQEQAQVPDSWSDWKLYDQMDFQVMRQWKGARVKTKTYFGVGIYDCGCPGGPIDKFEVGNEYLIFAEHKRFLTVCESERIGSDFVKNEMKRLDGLGLRLWASVWPF